MDEWSGADGLHHIEEYDITHLYVIPTFIHDMLAADSIEEADVSSLENISCGGATVPRAMVRNARDILGCSVCAGWGQTEDWLTTLTDPADSDEKINETDGYPMDGMEIKIEDPEDRYPGETGQLLVRGPWLMMGFYKRPEALEERMRDSWYVTGDLARIDDDGYVVITGREEDIIIRGGENVPVDVIEDLLYDHPKIDEAAVVAMPDDRLGERACAFVTVVAGETFTMKDLVDYLEDQDLTKQYFPEQMQLVDELPKTSLGKIDRLLLREQIADILGKDPV
jgi:non-ribosomal peptide synthetase component E (peptide arylation enzyme)